MIKDKLLENKVIYKVLKTVHNQYWHFIIALWKMIPKKNGEERSNHKFSIGIVTYVDRYESFFQPLTTNLVTIFPDTEIVIAINGYYLKDIQLRYLKDIELFTKKFKNVKIIPFVEPQSLSKLWNLLIINSSSDKIIILNDDIKISPTFRRNIERSGIFEQEIGLINKSWSHFLISKNIVRKIGWFDQRFPGMGNEDEDYECRLVFNNIELKTYSVFGINNIVFVSNNFCYGEDVETINVKYMKQNKTFFDSKWKFSNDPQSSFRFVKKVNGYISLQDGMDTPNFFAENILDTFHDKIIVE